ARRTRVSPASGRLCASAPSDSEARARPAPPPRRQKGGRRGGSPDQYRAESGHDRDRPQGRASGRDRGAQGARRRDGTGPRRRLRGADRARAGRPLAGERASAQAQARAPEGDGARCDGDLRPAARDRGDLHRPRRRDRRLRRPGRDRGRFQPVALRWSPSREGGEMTELATPPVEQQQDVKRISHWIGGRIVEGGSGRSGPVYNPAKGIQTGAVDFATVEEVDRVVQAAKAAFPAWRAVSLSRRTAILFRIRDLVDQRREEIGRILTAEHGKVLSDAVGEVARGLEVIEDCCGMPELLNGGLSEQASTGVDVDAIRQPLGVVAGISPFNFPAMVPMWMWAPAIACGNTFVLKPSEKDPSASLYVAELLQEAGLPDGVFNVVHGDKVAVDAVLEHREIAAVSFVGSTPIAKYVYEQGTSAGKRVQALGGAKNHMIVLPDADMDMAADAAVSAAYGSAG